MESLAGKTVVITGAGGGIGLALVSAFAARDCRVVACDRDADMLAGLDVAGRFDFDLQDASSIGKAAAAMTAEFGAPDCLINNAGWTRAELMADLSPEAIERELQLNLSGVMQFTQSLLPGMIERRSAALSS